MTKTKSFHQEFINSFSHYKKSIISQIFPYHQPLKVLTYLGTLKMIQLVKSKKLVNEE